METQNDGSDGKGGLLNLWPFFGIYHGPPNPTFLEVFMVNNLVFRWPKPVCFHGFGGSWYRLYVRFLGSKIGMLSTLCSPAA